MEIVPDLFSVDLLGLYFGLHDMVEEKLLQQILIHD